MYRDISEWMYDLQTIQQLSFCLEDSSSKIGKLGVVQSFYRRALRLLRLGHRHAAHNHQFHNVAAVPSWHLPPGALFVGQVPVFYQALRAPSMPYLATSPTKGLDERICISGSDGPDILWKDMLQMDHIESTRRKIVKGWNSWGEIRSTSGWRFKPACTWQWPARSMAQSSQEFTFFCRYLGERGRAHQTKSSWFLAVNRLCHRTSRTSMWVGTYVFLCLFASPAPAQLYSSSLEHTRMSYPWQRGSDNVMHFMQTQWQRH